MPTTFPPDAPVATATSHNAAVTGGVTSKRLPLDRLYQVSAINTTAWKRVNAEGFGTTRDPERRPRCPVVEFKR